MMPPGAYQPAFLRTADSCVRQGRGRRRELAQRAAESVHHPFVATIRPGADRCRPVPAGAAARGHGKYRKRKFFRTVLTVLTKRIVGIRVMACKMSQ